MDSIKHTLWLLPLISFFGSYYIFYMLFSPAVITTPCLIGKQLPEALQLLSDNNLNVRILSQKEDNDLPVGTILSQIPAEKSAIRPHQSLFVVLSKHMQARKAPRFIQKKASECLDLATKEGLLVKFYYLPYLIDDVCIGQIPSPETPLSDKHMTLYISAGLSKPVILPSLSKQPVEEVTSFLHEQGINSSIVHAKPVDPQHTCKKCIITQQKPLAGSLIDLKKPVTVQLFVQ